MSSKSKESSGADSSKPTKAEQSLFEEDDEFEEFPVEGKSVWCARIRIIQILRLYL